MFLIGLTAFAAASALCGLAWSAEALVAGRLIQGVASAVLAPQALASIHHLFPANEKARALGFFGFMIGSAAIVGQILSGLLIDGSAWGWRAVFLVNLPVAAVAIPAALFWLPESKGGTDSRLDFVGAFWLAAALTALVGPLIEGRELGWPVWSFVALALSPVLGAAFWTHEVRLVARGGNPLVQGTAMPTMIRAVIDGVDPRWSGLASGLVSATLQIGAALSVAMIGGLFFAMAGPAPTLASLTDAFGVALACIAGALGVGAFTIAGLRNRRAAVSG